MIQLQRTFRIATLIVVSHAIAVLLTTTPIAAAETASKSVDDDETPETTTTPTKKIDLGADKFWRALPLLARKDPSELTKGREALQAAADLEYTHAQTLLAECLMTGQNGFPKDQRKAANLYRLAAERGNAFAQVSLGQCLYSGIGTRKNQKKAAEWLTAALDEKADYSRPTPPEAYLAEAAKKTANTDTVAGGLDRDPVGDCQASAHYLLGLIASSDKKTDLAQKHFVQAATAGIDGRSGIYPAAVQAALNYAFGQGIPRDMTKANDMLAISRKLKMRAGVSMIHNFVSLKTVDEFAAGDLEESLSAEAEKFQTNTQFEIANSFTDKSTKNYNPAEAAKWYELAAESGKAWAMLELAFLYSGSGLGKPAPEKAFYWFEKAGSGDAPKHYLGTANLAICYYNGIGTAKDTNAAAALFKKFRDYEIICYLGMIGACPKTLITWDQRLKLLETWAKDKNDPQAQYLLAKRYYKGWGAPPDVSTALRWYKKAAEAGCGPAWTTLGVFHQQNRSWFKETKQESFDSAVKCFCKGSEAGDPRAMSYYADMLREGKGIARNDRESEKNYLRCLEIDPSQWAAHNNLAFLYQTRLENSEVYGDESIACAKSMIAHYEAAVRLNVPRAAANLGYLYAIGRFVDQDLRKAYRYIEQAAEWGMPSMHYQLGLMHTEGLGVPISYSEAAYHFRIDALEGDRRATEALVYLYVSGKLGSGNPSSQIFWLERAARMGDEQAMTCLVETLLNQKNYAAALKLLGQMSDSKSPTLSGFACNRLSYCYENGFGVEVDHERAKKYFTTALATHDGNALAQLGVEQMNQGKTQEAIKTFEQAIDHNSAYGSYYLGLLYFSGEKIEKNQARALQLMRKAANDGLAEALYVLAFATYDGVPDAPSLDEAIRFTQQAEAKGIKDAAELRAKLEQRRDGRNDTPSEETARARSA